MEILFVLRYNTMSNVFQLDAVLVTKQHFLAKIEKHTNVHAL